MASETVTTKTASSVPNDPRKSAPVTSPVLHRVCVQCNNMFRVTPDKFDAKQCPTCHKG